jgi:hypothetical protein
MKSASAKTRSQSSQYVNRNYIPQHFTEHQRNRQVLNEQHIISRTTEEKLSYLNKLGKQHPFCVIFKQKHHDPL